MNDFPSRYKPGASRSSSRSGALGFSLITLIAAASLQVDCAAQGDGADDSSVGGTGGAARTEVEIRIGPGGAAGGESEIHPLCGEGSCNPDTNSGCLVSPGTGGVGGATDGEWGGSGPGGEGGLLGWGGLSGNDEKGSACHVVPRGSCTGDDCEAVRSCGPSGRGLELDPCFTSGDCAAGLSCVGEGKAGVCRPYCCDGRCAANAYCEVRGQVGESVDVPVCVPLSNCALDDPFPCPEGSLCSCGASKACTLVGPGGRTACLKPGAGKQGDSCSGAVAGECGAGHVCAKTLGCLALCRSGESQNSCGAGFACQVPPHFPEGFGVCVSTGP